MSNGKVAIDLGDVEDLLTEINSTKERMLEATGGLATGANTAISGFDREVNQLKEKVTNSADTVASDMSVLHGQAVGILWEGENRKKFDNDTDNFSKIVTDTSKQMVTHIGEFQTEVVKGFNVPMEEFMTFCDKMGIDVQTAHEANHANAATFMNNAREADVGWPSV